MRHYRGAVVLAAGLLSASGAKLFGSLPATLASGALPVIEANDNRKPAGVLRNDTLRIHLVVQMARWYPEATRNALKH